MLKRLIPHPLLSLTLVLVWLGLVNTLTLGNLILGAVFGLAIPMLTAAYWPDRPAIARPLKVAEYILVVLWDIIVANVLVAKIILFKREPAIRSQWVPIPLELKSAEAITVLAGTITMTPGTVSATLAADGSAILVHCLHTDDPAAVRDEIKARYERRLLEIFP
ncbi:multisubunit potassium/proton antiporter, PhaE subunit [Jannaschia faecimaris]|uniref:Multisubunit potassium/proton antiporter, PhaE subunit n=1 Tax=Jannaschia faecimaris TaxID=1244108 RepID=A0A1H3PJ82_9RHOB|nr:Na+/H+ antiporter subunit E [Jannaschia faecimaris]SDZ00479.1 multisubunit potassium/proton antiporter, PhaE subunit [Jannaschia faecimaris]